MASLYMLPSLISTRNSVVQFYSKKAFILIDYSCICCLTSVESSIVDIWGKSLLWTNKCFIFYGWIFISFCRVYDRGSFCRFRSSVIFGNQWCKSILWNISSLKHIWWLHRHNQTHPVQRRFIIFDSMHF